MFPKMTLTGVELIFSSIIFTSMLKSTQRLHNKIFLCSWPGFCAKYFCAFLNLYFLRRNIHKPTISNLKYNQQNIDEPSAWTKYLISSFPHYELAVFLHTNQQLMQQLPVQKGGCLSRDKANKWSRFKAQNCNELHDALAHVCIDFVFFAKKKIVNKKI